MKTASIASIPRGLTALVASALLLGATTAVADPIDRIDPNSFDMRQLNQPQWTGEGLVVDMQEISITDFRADAAADRAVVATDTLGGAAVGGVLDKNHGQGIAIGANVGNYLGKLGIGIVPKPVVIPAVRYRVQLGFGPGGRPIYLPVEQLQVAGLELGIKLPMAVWVDKTGNKLTISPRHDVAMASVPPPPPAPPAVAPSASAPVNDTPLDPEMVAAQEKAAAAHALRVAAKAKADRQAKLDAIAKQEADDEAATAKMNGAANAAAPAAPAPAPSMTAPAAPTTPPAPIDP